MVLSYCLEGVLRILTSTRGIAAKSSQEEEEGPFSRFTEHIGGGGNGSGGRGRYDQRLLFCVFVFVGPFVYSFVLSSFLLFFFFFLLSKKGQFLNPTVTNKIDDMRHSVHIISPD